MVPPDPTTLVSSAKEVGVSPGDIGLPALAHDPARARSARRPWISAARRDLLIDVVMLSLAVLGSALTASAEHLRATSFTWSAMFGFTALVLLALRGTYRPRIGPRLLEDTRHVVSATAIAAMIVAFARVYADGDADAAVQAVREWTFAIVYLLAARCCVQLVTTKARQSGLASRPTVIVGAGQIGHMIAKRLLARPELGLRPVGFLDDDPLPMDDRAPIPLLGPTSELENVLARQRVEHAILSFSTAGHEADLDIARQLHRAGVGVSLVPRLFEAIPDRTELERLGGLPLETVYPTDPGGWQFSVKYAFDRVAAGLGMLVLSPLLAGIAFATLVTLGRPVLFRQRRLGRDGREFGMLKFRTMREATEGETADEAIEMTVSAGLGPGGVEGVDRRTRFGAFLRRTSLDELPQLFNVLRGDMSMVGPRPERDNLVARLEGNVHRYGDRHRVKSGITGWAQVNGLRGKTSLSDRVEWDNYYIENCSLWLDFKILLLTTQAVFRDQSE